MICAGPSFPKGKVVSTPVSHVDAYPTIVEVAGESFDAMRNNHPGVSLVAIAAGVAPVRTVLSEYHGMGSSSRVAWHERLSVHQLDGRIRTCENAGCGSRAAEHGNCKDRDGTRNARKTAGCRCGANGAGRRGVHGILDGRAESLQVYREGPRDKVRRIVNRGVTSQWMHEMPQPSGCCAI